MAKNRDKVHKGELIVNKGGRPSKFKEHYLQEVEDLMAQGYTDARICAQWGIARSTFYDWLQDNEDFKKSYERGKEKAEAWWEEFGLAGMTGKIPKFNATMWIAFMNNKFRWSRGEKKEDNKTQINIGNMQVLQNLQHMTDDELDAKINGLLENLGLEDESKGQTRDEEGTSSSTSGEGEAS